MDCRCHLTMRRSFSPQGDPPASPLVSLEIPAFLPSSSSITGPVFNAERPMFDVRRPLHDDRSPLRDVRHPVTRCQAPRYAMSGTPLRDVRHPVTRCPGTCARCPGACSSIHGSLPIRNRNAEHAEAFGLRRFGLPRQVPRTSAGVSVGRCFSISVREERKPRAMPPLLSLPTETPKHRNTETPKHRNTETPKHLFLRASAVNSSSSESQREALPRDTGIPACSSFPLSSLRRPTLEVPRSTFPPLSPIQGTPVLSHPTPAKNLKIPQSAPILHPI
jgi:hypothetical protein